MAVVKSTKFGNCSGMASDELGQLLGLIEKGRAKMAGRVVSVEEQRARYRKLAQLLPTPEGVTVEPVDADGVPAEWHRPTGGDETAAVVYFHGGGYCIGGADTHRGMAGHLAVATGVPVLVVDYRLAPEHPHPAPVTDAVSAYRWVLKQGVEPGRTTVAGDSAGGGLAVTTCLALRAEGHPLPGFAVLISPWTDVEGTGPTMTTLADVDPMVTGDGLAEMREWFLAGHDPQDPLVSPLHGDLAGLPPTLIHVGEREMLLDDALRLADRMRHAGVDVTCEVWPEMVHVWHMFAGQVPESDEGLAAIADWLRSRLTGVTVPETS